MTLNELRAHAVRLLLARMRSPLDPAAVTDEHSLEDLGLASLDLMNLMYDLEEALDIELDPEEMLGIGNVGELVAALHTRCAARETPAAG